MKLQVGKTYVTRDGRTAKVDLINTDCGIYCCRAVYQTGLTIWISRSGKASLGAGISPHDLIAESEPPAESTSRGGDVVGELRSVAERCRGCAQHGENAGIASHIVGWNSVATHIDAIASRLAQQGGTIVTTGMVEKFLHARVPGGAEVWHWLPQNEDGTPHETARNVVTAGFNAVFGLPYYASPTPTADRVSVPREATPEMLDVMRIAFRSVRRSYVGGQTAESCVQRKFAPELAAYNAMLAAAPSPSPAGESRAVVLPDAYRIPTTNKAGMPDGFNYGDGERPTAAHQLLYVGPPPHTWQPIETAPQNRTVLVGYRNQLGKWRTVRATYYTELEPHPDTDLDEPCSPGWYEEYEADDRPIYRCDCEPTHWQPLPPPPTTGDAREGQGDG